VKQTANKSGFTMLEMMIAVAIIGVLVAVAAPSFQYMRLNSKTKATARSVADMLDFARSKAMQTGDPHLVFFGLDMDGDPYVFPNGDVSAMFVLHDIDTPVVPANCRRDGGETVYALPQLEVDVALRRSNGDPPVLAVVPILGDVGDQAGVPINGMSFTLPNGGPAAWIIFGKDGIPRRFNAGADCDPESETEIGRGGGAVYVVGAINGSSDVTGRQYAVELTPMGGVKIHRYEWSTDSWRVR